MPCHVTEYYKSCRLQRNLYKLKKNRLKNKFMNLYIHIHMYANWTSFMKIALKERISIDEERQKLPSSSLLMLHVDLPFSAIIIKDVPDWEWIAFVKFKDCVFTCCVKAKKNCTYSRSWKWPKSETVFWKEFMITEKWKTIMPQKLSMKLYTSLLSSTKSSKPY